MRKITSPLDEKTVAGLKAGDQVLMSGVIYVARDSAHKRMVEALDRGEKLPFDVKDQTVYYMGPSPAKPGQVIGSAGPTTAGRMDFYAPRLMQEGLRAMVAKGSRLQPVKDAMVKYKAVYFAAVGGAGALIAKTIKKSELVAYEDLGAEAILRLEVEDLPLVVVNDIYGNDVYEQGRAKYEVKAAGKA